MIVKEEKKQQLLEKNGFFVTSLLTEDQLNLLRKLYVQSPMKNVGFTASAHMDDIQKRKEISNKIKKAVEPSLADMFINIDVLGASFVVKSSDYPHVLQPHQDWNIVDETKHRSYNIWIPLVDTNQDNGGILVMPGSHNWIQTYRHSSIPCAFQDVHGELLKVMLTLNIPAGHALVYDHALIHASHPNISSENRVAIAVGIKPNNASMHLHWNNNGKIEKYNVDEHYFMEKNIFNKPEKHFFSEVIHYDFPKVNFSILSELSGFEFEKEPSIITKSWYKTYTPRNILMEILFRIKRISG